MTPLRAALVGVGRIADMHYLGYSATPMAELVAICDSDPDLLKRRASEWGVEKTHTDFDQLLEDPAVDAVDIITPHYLHAPMTIAALEAGKHVTVQKPMALSVADADAMIEAAERTGRLLRVIDNYRFHPPFVRAKQILESGGIGEPMSIRIKTASGTAPDGWEIPQSSHVWRSDPTLSGRRLSSLRPRPPRLDDCPVPAWRDRARLRVHRQHRGGQASRDRAGWDTRQSGHDRLEIRGPRSMYGTCESVHSEELIVRSTHYPIDASFEITGTRGILYIHQGPNGQLVNRPPIEILRDGSMTSISNVETDYAAGFRLAIEDFVQAISDGRASDLTGEEGREVLRFSLAMVRSGREGQGSRRRGRALAAPIATRDGWG